MVNPVLKIKDETENNVEVKQIVPEKKAMREFLLHHIQQYAEKNKLVPPLSLNVLQTHAKTIINILDTSTEYVDYATVLLSNCVWQQKVAEIPFKRRILLLPQCLRKKSECPAEMDNFGLLCEQCGQCVTGEIQDLAEELGYLVLIAEGTTVVTKLIESNQIDAVVGVSCMATLERSFPYTNATAVPSIAVPLTRDGCDNTAVDVDYLKKMIQLNSPSSNSEKLNLEKIKTEVHDWFKKENLTSLVRPGTTQTEKIAFDWLGGEGKRWRPILSAGVYRALQEVGLPFTESVKKLAIAVECFHKASLVHDDIEDDDDQRYEELALHRQHGIPVALNIGDFLLGEGYRLIAESGVAPELISRLLRVAAAGHRELCLGQGEELYWVHNPWQLSVEDILNIYHQKTAPAFKVALLFGALSAGAKDDVCQVLEKFSEMLGIAYQIKDDIEDFDKLAETRPVPSILISLALGKLPQDSPFEKLSLFKNGYFEPTAFNIIKDVVSRLNLKDEAQELFQKYKTETLNSLEPLKSYRLKSMLFQVAYKILGTKS